VTDTRRRSFSQPTGLRAILGRNQDLLRNAGSLVATTGVTSVLGSAYWLYAAREFAQQAVGYGTAAISVMTLLGTIGMFGLGTMLIGELPQREAKGGLMSAVLIASFAGSLVLGAGFALISAAFGHTFVEIGGTLARMVVFSLGVAATAATFVFDESTIGLMRGGLQLSRNITFSIVKMAVLPVCAIFVHDLFGLGIMLSWVIGTFVSVIPVAVTLKRGGASLLHKPDWRSLRRLGRLTLAHNWLNLAITTPAKLIPVIVVAVVSPSANAAFYVAFMLASFLYIVPQSLSTVLFAIASATPELIGEKLRFVLRMSMAIGVPVCLVLAAFAHLALSIFGSGYAAQATFPLWLLILGYFPGIPNAVYIAVYRATGRVAQAAVFLAVFAAIQLVAIAIGGKLGGLHGLSYGMLAVAIIEAAITTPTVLRAAYGRAVIQSAEPYGATAAPPAVATARRRDRGRDEEIRLRQEAGLAALIAIATAVQRPQHQPMPVAGASQWTVDRGRHRRALNATSPDGMAALMTVVTHGARV
jgi:O-antigen/teichoic acid export membrane protein